MHSPRRGISLGLFFNQGIDEIDSIVEACLFALIDKRRTQGDSNMGFTGSGATNKDQIVGILCKLAGSGLFNLRLFHRR